MFVFPSHQLIVQFSGNTDWLSLHHTSSDASNLEIVSDFHQLMTVAYKSPPIFRL